MNENSTVAKQESKKKHIITRTITALLTASAIVLLCLYAPKFYLMPIVFALVVLVQIEFCQMVKQKYDVLTWPCIIFGAFFYLFVILFSYLCIDCQYNCPLEGFCSLLSGLIYIGIILSIALAFLCKKTERPLVAIAIGGFSIFYIPFLLSPLAIVPIILDMKWLLYMIAIIKISDMGGFAFGMAFGKHKMCPTISPNKSWEGLAGSIFSSAVISCVFMPLTKFPFVISLIIGIVAALLGTMGDLVESRIKREIGVKDSSQFKWTNGMGGFLDMVDSLLFSLILLMPIILSLYFYFN